MSKLLNLLEAMRGYLRTAFQALCLGASFEPLLPKIGALYMHTRRMVKPRFWLLMMASMAIVFICLSASQSGFMAHQTERIKELEAKRLEMLADKAVLERQIAFTKTEKYIERVAHQSLGLVRDDEIVFELQ